MIVERCAALYLLRCNEEHGIILILNGTIRLWNAPAGQSRTTSVIPDIQLVCHHLAAFPLNHGTFDGMKFIPKSITFGSSCTPNVKHMPTPRLPFGTHASGVLSWLVCAKLLQIEISRPVARYMSKFDVDDGQCILETPQISKLCVVQE